MAAPIDDLRTFADDVYLTIKNRFFDEIEGEDGVVYVNQVVRWITMFLDELETAVDPNGMPIDWWFMRASGATLGTVTEGNSSITIPTTILRVLTDEQRYVQITVDGKVVSNWPVVHPKNMPNRSSQVKEDRCAVVGTSLVFSRAFRDTEANGTITGDVVNKLIRPSLTNVKVFNVVQPRQLLVLGVSKNATLPDIVQGGLSPSYVQKYNDLLQGAIARSNATSQSQDAAWQDMSDVRGVY
jgi:hypothetical protein